MTGTSTDRKPVRATTYRPIWDTMFLVALNYPDRPTPFLRKQFKAFYKALVRVIPCRKCRSFAIRVLEREVPMNFKDHDTLFKSVWRWKTRVNRKLGKPNITYRAAYLRWHRLVVRDPIAD